MKDDIKLYYIPWTAVGSIDQKCNGVKEDNLDGNTENFLFGTSNYESLVSLDITMLVVDDSSKVR